MKQVIIIIGALILGAVSYWLIAPLFIDKEVQDELDPELLARIEAQRQVDEAREAREANAPAAESEVADEPKTEPVAETKPEPELTTAESFGIQTSGPFPIVDTPGHPATGVVEVIESPEEQLIFFKDYEGTNGPDLKVYLAKDLDAEEFVDLGVAKGNRGNLIYGVPLDIDISEYKYVMTWCRAFGVLFDYAEIN